MINVGVIGYGYWGPNLVRNFMESSATRVLMVSDLRPDRLTLVRNRYPAIETVTDYQRILSDPRIEAVAIATPVSSHYALGSQALAAGKHVLIEKPMAASVDEAERLVELAERHQRILMVDHTFVYTGAVRKIHELLETRAIGDVYYFDSVRVNLGLFQHDVNVIWDLAVHDLSIMDYILGRAATAVSAVGMSHIAGQPANIAYVTVFFEGNLMAHLHVNWLAPVKIRRTLIGGSQKMIVYDELDPSEKVKVYDAGITLSSNNRPAEDRLHQMLIGYRTGDMWAPQLDRTEALHREVQHFADCIQQQQRPLTDGQAGLRVVRILEAAATSLAQQGRPIELAQASRGN